MRLSVDPLSDLLTTPLSKASVVTNTIGVKVIDILPDYLVMR